jgi:hypothetical protein
MALFAFSGGMTMTSEPIADAAPTDTDLARQLPQNADDGWTWEDELLAADDPADEEAGYGYGV